jgi:SAM-dependent methyltransferase
MRLLDRLRRRVAGAPSNEAPRSRAHESWAAWSGWRSANEDRLDAQYRLQQEVGIASAGEGWPGWCGLCSRPVVFPLPAVAAAAGGDALLRETLVCPGCRMRARSRAAMALLVQDLVLSDARIYLTEQVTPAFVWMQSAGRHVEGSEFGMDAAAWLRLQLRYSLEGGRGLLVDRDVTRLDFADASLDAIGSFEVLEHVPDYPAALREFARCLRPGGRLVLTAPFLEKDQRSLVRARIGADGGIEHLCEPEIHGDPVSGGVLCFHHFGWDLLEACRAAGFSRVAWVRTWSPREAMFGLWTLVATR